MYFKHISNKTQIHYLIFNFPYIRIQRRNTITVTNVLINKYNFFMMYVYNKFLKTMLKCNILNNLVLESFSMLNYTNTYMELTFYLFLSEI